MTDATKIQKDFEDDEDRRKRESAQAQLDEITSGAASQIPQILRIAVERGWIHLLPDMLSDLKEKKEDDIVKLCQRYYRGYLDSVQQLVKMREDCVDVRNGIVAMNESLQRSGSAVVSCSAKTKKLAEKRKDISQKSQVIRACRDIVALAQRAKSQMASKRYVSAVHSLKILDEVLHQSLVVDTPIAKALLTWLPGAQQSVISANRQALEEWLITSRLQARKVGSTLRGRLELITSEANQHHRTAVLKQVEVYLGFGVWCDAGSVEPMVRHVLKHAAMPEMKTKSSLSKLDEMKADGGGKGGGFQNDRNSEGSDDSSTSSTSSAASSQVTDFLSSSSFDANSAAAASKQRDDLSSEAAAKVMEDLVTSLGTLDHASHVHATRSPKHLAEFRILYCRLRAPHFSPKSLLQQHLAQDIQPLTDFSKPKQHESEKAMKKWVVSVLAWPDLLDTLGGFFAMERTLCSIAAVPRALFARTELDGLWLDACDELAGMVNDQFLSFESAMAVTPRSFWSTIQENTSKKQVQEKQAQEKEIDAKEELMQDPSVGFVVIKLALIGLTKALGVNTYGFSSEPILNQLRMNLNQFISCQLKVLECRIESCLATKANQPMVVPDNTAFERWIEPFGLDSLSDGIDGEKNNANSFLEFYGKKDLSSQQRRFPMTFGFSAAVPLCCHALHRSLVLITDFAQDLDDIDYSQIASNSHELSGFNQNQNQSSSQSHIAGNIVYEELLLSRKTLLRKSAAKAMMLINELLLNELSQEELVIPTSSNGMQVDDSTQSGGKKVNLVSTVKAVSISQAAQISLDARAFAGLMPRIGAVLEHALSSFAWFDEDDARFLNKITVVDACKALDSTADQAQDLIFELVREKCDDLICLDTFVWEPSTVPDSARSETLDLISYLRVTFMCLTYLPSSIREAVHFASCSHVHSSLRMELMMNVKKVNVLALFGLRLDIIALESFSDECGVPQLRAVFKPLRQLLDALLDKNASKVFGDEATRMAMYPQLDANDVVMVLEKVVGLPVVARMKTSGRSDLPGLDKKSANELMRLIQS